MNRRQQGRPKAATKELHSSTLALKMTPAEFAIVTGAARKAGLPPSTFARVRLLEALRLGFELESDLTNGRPHAHD